jgi:hypothetical protein
VTGDVLAIAFALAACTFALYKLLSGSDGEPTYRPRRPEERGTPGASPSDDVRRHAGDEL